MGAREGHRWLRGGLALVASLSFAVCASPPVLPRPGLAGVAGTVELIPHEGLPSHAGPGAYGDRRLRDVKWVDYSTPGFAVVYLDAASRPGGRVALTIEPTRTGVRLAPRFDVVGVGGEIAIANRSTRAAVVSLPGMDRIERLDAGVEISMRVDLAGPVQIYLLGTDRPSVIWAAPGPWARPDADGRYALTDLPPGPATLRAWHPRLPGAVAEVELVADAVASVDFQLGVGRGDGP